MDGSVRKIAVVVNLDNVDERHLENAQRSADRLLEEGYTVHFVNPIEYEHKNEYGDRIVHYSKGSESLKEILAGLQTEKELDNNDDFLVYVTGHGYLNDKGTLWLSEGEGKEESVSSDEFISLLNNIKYGQRTILMDQCYSGSWGKFFANGPSTFFLGLSPSSQTTHCDPFQKLFWSAGMVADADGNGTVTFGERFRSAMQKSGEIVYEHAILLQGEKYIDDGFGSSGITDIRPEITTVTKVEELEQAIQDLTIDDYMLVAFTAPEWCEPCKEMEGIYPKLPPNIRVIKVDLSNMENYGLFGKSRFKISALPQFRLYGRGLIADGMPFEARTIGDSLPTLINTIIAEKDPLAVFKEWLYSGDIDRFKTAWETFGNIIEGSIFKKLGRTELKRVGKLKDMVASMAIKILDSGKMEQKLIILNDRTKHIYSDDHLKKLNDRVLDLLRPDSPPEMIVAIFDNWTNDLSDSYYRKICQVATSQEMLGHNSPLVRRSAVGLWKSLLDSIQLRPHAFSPKYYRRVVVPQLRARVHVEEDQVVIVALAKFIISDVTQGQYPPSFELSEAVALLKKPGLVFDWGNMSYPLGMLAGELIGNPRLEKEIKKIFEIVWQNSSAGTREMIELNYPELVPKLD